MTIERVVSTEIPAKADVDNKPPKEPKEEAVRKSLRSSKVPLTPLLIIPHTPGGSRASTQSRSLSVSQREKGEKGRVFQCNWNRFVLAGFLLSGVALCCPSLVYFVARREGAEEMANSAPFIQPHAYRSEYEQGARAISSGLAGVVRSAFSVPKLFRSAPDLQRLPMSLTTEDPWTLRDGVCVASGHSVSFSRPNWTPTALTCTVNTVLGGANKQYRIQQSLDYEALSNLLQAKVAMGVEGVEGFQLGLAVEYLGAHGRIERTNLGCAAGCSEHHILTHIDAAVIAYVLAPIGGVLGGRERSTYRGFGLAETLPFDQGETSFQVESSERSYVGTDLTGSDAYFRGNDSAYGVDLQTAVEFIENVVYGVWTLTPLQMIHVVEEIFGIEATDAEVVYQTQKSLGSVSTARIVTSTVGLQQVFSVFEGFFPGGLNASSRLRNANAFVTNYFVDDVEYIGWLVAKPQSCLHMGDRLLAFASVPRKALEAHLADRAGGVHLRHTEAASAASSKLVIASLLCVVLIFFLLYIAFVIALAPLLRVCRMLEAMCAELPTCGDDAEGFVREVTSLQVCAATLRQFFKNREHSKEQSSPGTTKHRSPIRLNLEDHDLASSKGDSHSSEARCNSFLSHASSHSSGGALPASGDQASLNSRASFNSLSPPGLKRTQTWRARHAPSALASEGSLAKKDVAVCFTRATYVSKIVSSLTEEGTAQFIESVVAFSGLFCEAVSRAKGTVLFLNLGDGDCAASWGAHTKVISKYSKAVDMALGFVKHCAEVNPTMICHCAVSRGPSWVGQHVSGDARNFFFLGFHVTEALGMVKIGQHYNCHVTISKPKELESYTLLPIDCVDLTGVRSKGGALILQSEEILVYHVLCAPDRSNEEWMYQFSEKEFMPALFAAYKAFLCGSYGKAEKLANKVASLGGETESRRLLNLIPESSFADLRKTGRGVDPMFLLSRVKARPSTDQPVDIGDKHRGDASIGVFASPPTPTLVKNPLSSATSSYSTDKITVHTHDTHRHSMMVPGHTDDPEISLECFIHDVEERREKERSTRLRSSVLIHHLHPEAT